MGVKESCGPRGRPRGFCLEQAVATALGLFKDRGYDGVGVAELAQAIGVAPPSLYAAFGSKAGLYARALDLYQEREGAWIARALATSGPPRDILAALFRGAALAFAGEPHGCLVCRGEQGCADPDVAELSAERRRAMREVIKTRLCEVGAADPAAQADYAMAGLHALTGAARDGADEDGLRYIAERLATGA